MTAGRRLRFGAQQDGGATALGLFSISLMLLFAAVTIDVANLYHHQTLLQLTADSAARGGLVTLERGGKTADIHSATRGVIEKNLPEARFGQLITDPNRELQVLHYDPATGGLEVVGIAAPANAVLVRLQRSEAAGNPLPTFLMGMAGHDAWSLSAASVAVLQPTQRCGNAEGIVARGAIDLGPPPAFNSDFCLHSQSSITLPPGTRSVDPLRISLPNASDCVGVCGPGTPASRFSPVALNLVMPVTLDHVVRLAAGFVDTQINLPEETAYFASRGLTGDAEAVREVGLGADNLRAGDVLQMTPLQFSQMRERPGGLVYDVRCDTVQNDSRPLWERTLTLTGTEGVPTLRDLVLVTDCALELDSFVRIEGALILMTGSQGAQILAQPGAMLGDTNCDAARRVRLMASGDFLLPADLAGGNVSVVAGGDILLGSNPDHQQTAHTGLVLHAGGRVMANGSHSFARCPTEATFDPLMPAMQVITHVMPPLGNVLSAPEQARPVQTELPGEEVDRMPGDATDRMPMKGTIGPGS